MVGIFQGEAPDTEIGRVYVDDPDDWDIGDKTFDWIDGSHPNFDLNSDTGMITMLQGVKEESYILRFKVFEIFYFFLCENCIVLNLNNPTIGFTFLGY